MLRSLQIKNFRCFEGLTIDPLERVNLIGGMNNVGKTSLLEAILVYINPSDPTSLLAINQNRGIGFKKIEEFKGFFFDQNLSGEIVIKGADQFENQYSLKIYLGEPEEISLPNEDESSILSVYLSHRNASLTTERRERGKLLLVYQDEEGKQKTSKIESIGDINRKKLTVRGFSDIREKFPVGIYITASSRSPEEDAKRFSDLERVGRQEEVLETLQLIEPRLKRLTLLVIDRETIIHGDIGMSELVPIPLMGEGLGRLLSILLAIANAKGGTVLIDEIENGLHYSVLFDVWRAIAHAARRADVQIFATTHSQECIRAAHRAFESSEQYDFRYHRLERVDKVIKAVTYDRETLGFSDEMSLEMR